MYLTKCAFLHCHFFFLFYFLPAPAQFHQAAALLHSLEESLKCTICNDIFTVPVSILPCNHSFCNNCIRQKINEDASETPSCPLCATPLDASGDLSKCIILNRNHEETARHYRSLRPILKSALVISTTTDMGPSSSIKGNPTSGVKRKFKPRGPHAKLPALLPDQIAANAALNAAGTADGDSDKKIPKRTNLWIRNQFREEFIEEKQTWAFICIHCGETAFRSRVRKMNATKLTEHITQRCTAASQQLRDEAVSHTDQGRRKTTAAPQFF